MSPAKRRQFGRGYTSSGWAKRPPAASVYSFYWSQIRLEVLRRDKYVCQLRLAGCLGKATEADHIDSVADGGEHSLENGRAVCQRCHRTRTGQQGAAAANRNRRQG